MMTMSSFELGEWKMFSHPGWPRINTVQTCPVVAHASLTPFLPVLLLLYIGDSCGNMDAKNDNNGQYQRQQWRRRMQRDHLHGKSVCVCPD